MTFTLRPRFSIWEESIIRILHPFPRNHWMLNTRLILNHFRRHFWMGARCLLQRIYTVFSGLVAWNSVLKWMEFIGCMRTLAVQSRQDAVMRAVAAVTTAVADACGAISEKRPGTRCMRTPPTTMTPDGGDRCRHAAWISNARAHCPQQPLAAHFQFCFLRILLRPPSPPSPTPCCSIPASLSCCVDFPPRLCTAEIATLDSFLLRRMSPAWILSTGSARSCEYLLVCV